MLGSELVKHSQASNVNRPVCISSSLPASLNLTFITDLPRWWALLSLNCTRYSSYLRTLTQAPVPLILREVWSLWLCSDLQEPLSVLQWAEPILPPSRSSGCALLQRGLCPPGAAFELLSECKGSFFPSWAPSACKQASALTIRCTARTGQRKNANKNADKFKVKP